MEDRSAALIRPRLPAALLAALLAVTACDDPTLNAGITIGAHGVSVTPTLSGDIGGVGVAITPGTIE